MPRIRIPILALVADVVAVVVFAALGQLAHGVGDGVLGMLGTAFPFVVGVVAAWVLPRVREAPASLSAGGWVAAAAIGVGLALWWGFTGRLPWQFVLVTAVMLTLLTLGWRILSFLVARRVRPGSREIPRG